ncbi:MAG: nucleotidyltransferase domain-containing protein [Chloroflexi bacterium]|nr:nucleotidyltransferase domain-containing protein [Chloroflexota bacterium]
MTTAAPAHRLDDSLSPKISEAAARLHAARPDAAIVLFGSHARGEAHEGSDVDFLVVLSEAPASPRQEMARLCRLLYPLQVWADVLVTGAQRFRESAAVPGTLHHSVAREGKVLYGSLE